VLKHELEDNVAWRRFTRLAVQTRQQVQQTRFVTLHVNAEEVTITIAVPDATSGAEFTQNVPFDTQVKQVQSGTVTIPVGTRPVYVEEGVMSAPAYEVTRSSVFPQIDISS
jgi:hypothetical protein